MILVRLAFIASFNSEAWPVKCTKFRILKIRSNLRALTTANTLVPVTKKDRYIEYSDQIYDTVKTKNVLMWFFNGNDPKNVFNGEKDGYDPLRNN